ncbi:MAG: hypothetical protein JSS69_05830 [Acidobacteria bacterium]|nr:hypothetical protein [Acidobacteriota bacterium]MBS1865421.1 hypothetical protein [Acidobacteriota bacterium]
MTLVAIVAAILLLIHWVAPRAAEHFFGFVEVIFAKTGGRPLLAFALLFFGVLAVRIALLPLLPVPVPGIHDEFSYLLMSDTFAHGRLANPTHPMWRSFETFHVNWFPTYSSMYPPAQGAVLALGQVLGSPWIGVLLSSGAMCATIYWMLCAWMPARWAFLGGALAALKLGFTSYWMNSYWGGAVAAIGGSLVLGALARIFKRANLRDALLLGLGIAILANSRPYEGLVFCLPAAFLFLRWLWKKSHSAGDDIPWTRVLIPLTLVLFLTFTFMGYYNWRLTGNALLFPHTLNERNYESVPNFVWEKPQPEKHYNNDRFEEFYNVWEREEYARGWGKFREISNTKTTRLASAFLWQGLVLVLPGLFPALRDKKFRVFWVALLCITVSVYAVVWSNAHYAAPATCLIFALITLSLRYLRTLGNKRFALGKALSRATVLLLVLDTSAAAIHHECDPLQWTCTGDVSRTLVLQKLQAEPGKHLVMVRYNEDDLSVHDEWVYNSADIDSSKIVWARELDKAQNEKLLQYFKDRKVWLATTDDEHLVFRPYEISEDK